MREITVGKVLIMGRKTWESIPEKRRPLPNRVNVVITRQADYLLPEGVERFDSVEEAVQAHSGQEIVGFGGTHIFEKMIGMADTLDITHVDQEIDACDAWFPQIDPTKWEVVKQEKYDGFSFVTYKRRH